MLSAKSALLAGRDHPLLTSLWPSCENSCEKVLQTEILLTAVKVNTILQPRTLG